MQGVHYIKKNVGRLALLVHLFVAVVWVCWVHVGQVVLSWGLVGDCSQTQKCTTTLGEGLKQFIKQVNWPEEVVATGLGCGPRGRGQWLGGDPWGEDTGVGSGGWSTGRVVGLTTTLAVAWEETLVEWNTKGPRWSWGRWHRCLRLDGRVACWDEAQR